MKAQRLIAVIATLVLIGNNTALADDNTQAPIDEGGIAPQALDTALEEFAERSGLQVIYLADVAKGKQSLGAEPELSDQATLDQLLASTNLEYEYLNENTVTLQMVADEGGDSDSKNPSPAPVLMAQNATSPTQSTASNQNSERGASVVTGRVTDARTGANLRGAKVTIEETGQWTSTGDLGRFRFASVPSGAVTLTVSFLGYAGQSAVIGVRGDSVSQDFALRGGDEIEEIVVFGQRSARSQALNQERTAPNSQTILNADALGNFNGTTISEALRRAPGVAFIPDPTTGEGSFLIFRGLEPDLNQITLNGIRLLDGTGLGRAPDLSNILTESIESVTINRSLLPSDQSSGAGAFVEIETKGPLDRNSRFASFGFEYGENGGDFGDELGVNGVISGRFGVNQDFGVSLSGSFRERTTTRLSYSALLVPEILPFDDAGQPVIGTFEIDPRRSFPFEDGASGVYPNTVDVTQGEANIETLSVIGSLQKVWNDHTELRLDAVYSEETSSNVSLGTSVAVFSGYDLLPIPELGGQERYRLLSEDGGIFGGFARIVRSVPEQDTSTLSLSFRGDTQYNLWEFRYGVGFAKSESANTGSSQISLDDLAMDNEIPLNILLDSALANTTSDGRVISIFRQRNPGDDSFLTPLFNNDGFDFYNTVDNLSLGVSDFGPRTSDAEETTIEGSIRRSFRESPIRYVEIGATYTDSEFFSPARFITEASESGFGFLITGAGVSSSDLGLRFGPSLLSAVGIQDGFLSLDPNTVQNLVTNIDSFVEQGQLVPFFGIDPTNQQESRTGEEIFNAYIEGQAMFGNIEIIGGIRFESIDLSANSFVSPTVRGLNDELLLDPNEFGQFLTESADQTEILPRILVNYRPKENMVFRASYFVTASRPQLSNLTSQRRLTLDLDPLSSTTDDRPVLTVRQGNPDLEPAKTNSFGLDWEWYFSNAGVVKVAGFYKEIQDPLQTTAQAGGLEVLPNDLALPNVPFYEDLPSPIEVRVTKPINGETDDKIWGVELTAERQLSFLPSAFDGLGVYANYTYTDSEGTRQLAVSTSFVPEGFVEINAPIFQAPEHQGTFGFTYTNHGFDGGLLYTAQSRRLASIDRFGLDTYNEAIGTLDFALNYIHDFGQTSARFFVRGTDLLSSEKDPYLQTSVGGGDGVPKYYTGATYFGGRSIFLGISTVF